jgi:hypothetical protein
VRPPSDTPVVPRTTALLAQIEALQTEITRLQYELSKSEGTAAGHRADYERERDRCDRLVAELGVISARIAAWPLPGRRSWWRWLRSAA